MSGLRFDEVERQILVHYAEGAYGQALSVLDRFGPQLPAQWERVAYWRACLLSRSGQAADALDTLWHAVEAGAWWSPRLLEMEADLDPLWEIVGYRQLLEVMADRLMAWNPAVSGLYLTGVPGGWPFLGLHGRNQVYETDADHIAGTLGDGWQVAIPESRERIASDGPVWDDPDVCREEAMAVASRLWDERPFVIGGFSQGARRALQIGLGHGRQVRGVLAVAPMTLRRKELAEVIGAIGHGPWPLVAIVAGAEDPAAGGAATLARHLEDEGIETRLEIRPGRGHEWIHPSAATLTALATTVSHSNQPYR